MTDKQEGLGKTRALNKNFTEIWKNYERLIETKRKERRRLLDALQSNEFEIADMERAMRAAELAARISQLDDGSRAEHEAAKDKSNDEALLQKEVQDAALAEHATNPVVQALAGKLALDENAGGRISAGDAGEAFTKMGDLIGKDGGTLEPPKQPR